MALHKVRPTSSNPFVQGFIDGKASWTAASTECTLAVPTCWLRSGSLVCSCVSFAIHPALQPHFCRKRHIPVVVCGHIHEERAVFATCKCASAFSSGRLIFEAYGFLEDGSTLFINASTCTLRYRQGAPRNNMSGNSDVMSHGLRPEHPPVVFDMPPVADLHPPSVTELAKE